MTEQDILIINSDSTHVDVELSFDNGINTIKNNKIYSESMSLIDSISDSESIVFGKCNISQFQVKVADFEGDIDGALMNVLLKFSNAELGDCEYNLGQYIVHDSERTSDKMFRIITAYDKMSLFNVDIANWYNYTLFPFEVVDNNLGWLPVNENGVVIDLTYSVAGEPRTSLDKNDDGAYYLNTDNGTVYVGYATYDESGEFASVEWRTYLQCEKNESYTESCNVTRTVNEILAMLCEYVGVPYNTDFVLVNGGVVVKRDFNPQSLNGLDFLQQICELNGVFGHINNNGILDFIAPDKSTKQTVDAFKKCDYSDYTVQPINSVSIKYDSNDMGTAVTRAGIEKLNQYDIVGNIFLQSVKTEDELKTIAGNILSVIENISYIPCSIEVKCGLSLELGDYITVNAKTIKEESVSSVSFDTLVLCRNISGIQSIFNRIEAKGTEYVNKNAESLSSQLQITNKTIDKLYKEYTANNANFMYLYSKAITTDSLTANVANIGTLNANSAFVKFLQTNVVDANYIRAVTAEIGYLTADSAIISNLQTTKLNTSDLNAENAKLGYLTAGSAVITDLQTNKLNTNELNSKVADLGYLTAKSAVITSLQTDKLNASELNSEVAKLGYLTASDAVITSLQTGKLDTSKLSAEVAKLGYLDAKMANIDFANLNKANIGQLFANVGLISSATITDGHVTGYLDSVEVNANKITAGTLAVDRLLIKDSSGNYKMATYDSSGNLVTTTIDGSVITERTITADHLVAGTITANEINMTNLVGNSAFINAINTNSVVVSASNNASNALSTANSANTKAQGIIDNIYTTNTTTINGGKITTGSIKAAQIDVNDLFAHNITATGTITGAHLVGSSGEFSRFMAIEGDFDNGDYGQIGINEMGYTPAGGEREIIHGIYIEQQTPSGIHNSINLLGQGGIKIKTAKNNTVVSGIDCNVDGTLKLSGKVSVSSVGTFSSPIIYENGTALSNKYAPIGLQTSLNNKLDKTTYEYNKELSMRSSGKLCIGRFPCYDSNISIEIKSTTNTTYNGTLIIATQNINTNLGGVYKCVVYGDETNTLTNLIKIEYLAGSNVFSVYMDFPSWSKNLLHIQCVNITGTPTDVATKIDSIPSTATIVPTNAFTHTHDYLPLSGGTINGTLNATTIYENGTLLSSKYLGINANAVSSSRLTTLDANDKASSSDTWRRVWISYNNNTEGRPAWTNNLTFQTSTNTLKTTNFEGNLIGNASSATKATTMQGAYTYNGGQQNPDYFGRNKVGALMMNTSINGNSHYKDFLIMDCYDGNDVGGATAIGVDRQEMRAFIMGSDAVRTSWTRSAELITTSNIGSQSVNYANSAGSAPASDVYSWAKASTKPSYSWDEISGRPTVVSAFSNDANYITSSGSTAYNLTMGNASNVGYIDYYNNGNRTRLTANASLASTTTVRLPATGGTLALASSDARLKENVDDSVVNAISLIKKIKMRQFDWNNNQQNGNLMNTHQDIGFIADELEELDERLSIGGGVDLDGEMNIKTVDTFYLLGYVVKALQEIINELGM